MATTTASRRSFLGGKGTGRALTASLLAVGGAVALAGCSKAIRQGWTPYTNGVLNIAALVVLTVLTGAFLAVVFRRRLLTRATSTDEAAINAAIRTAIGAGQLAVWIYDAAAVCVWNDVGRRFPLAWRPGAMIGVDLRDAIPAGPLGDEARAAYVAVLTERRPVVYLRADVGPAGGAAWIEYSHAPTPTGGGICVARDVTAYVDRADRAEREAKRQRERADRASEAAETAGVAQFAASRIASLLPTTTPAP